MSVYFLLHWFCHIPFSTWTAMKVYRTRGVWQFVETAPGLLFWFEKGKNKWVHVCASILVLIKIWMFLSHEEKHFTSVLKQSYVSLTWTPQKWGKAILDFFCLLYFTESVCLKKKKHCAGNQPSVMSERALIPHRSLTQNQQKLMDAGFCFRGCKQRAKHAVAWRSTEFLDY